MELNILGSMGSFTLTATRLPEGKFSVRSGTSRIETVILADRVLAAAFRQRLADLLPDPDRASEREVEASEAHDE
jgi:hypothetical protein